MFARLLSLLATLVAVSNAAWVMQPDTTATVIFGVGSGDAGLAIAGASKDGTGAVVENYDGVKWSNTRLEAGLLFDATMSYDGALRVITSMLPVFISSGGDDYVQLSNIGGSIMSSSVFGEDDQIGVVGSLIQNKASVNGVAVSSDKGQTWVSSAVPSGYTRYASFVDANTFYVSAGIWGDDSAAVTNATLVHHVSAVVGQADSIAPTHSRLRFRGQRATPAKSGKVGDVNANGWLASVSKTTDGGKTWSEVFHLPEGDSYYFNGISCVSPAHCVVVGEGETSTEPYITLALVTTDGGATWVQSFYSTELFSLMSVSMTSETDGWLAGVAKQKGEMVGQFFQTTDGGKSWTLSQSLSNCYPLDMDFTGGQGVASCISSSGSSATVALYTA